MPRATRSLLALAVAAGLGFTASADAKPHGQDPNQCAHVEAKPVYAKGGFSHVVRVSNTCTEVVTCEVWTSIDSKTKATLNVPASGQAQATLRDSSPISLFRAKGTCSF